MRSPFAKVLHKLATLVGSPAVASLPPVGKALQDAQGNLRDEQVRLISQALPGWLLEGNLHCFQHALGNLPSDAPILEIGSWCGLSANILTYFKTKLGVSNRLFTCDPWDYGRGQAAHTSILIAEYSDYILDNFLRSVQMFSTHDLPSSFRLSSAEFFAAWRKGEELSEVFGRSVQLGGPLSFCYIDGDHSYAGAWSDFENCDEFLLPGGFLLFDDSSVSGEWQEVVRVVTRVQESGRYELVLRNPNHLFQKR